MLQGPSIRCMLTLSTNILCYYIDNTRPDKKSKQKPRHIRHAQVRVIRRSLASINPETSHPQNQSPLFSTLPSEIRNLIFQYAVCQQYDISVKTFKDAVACRPGHVFRTEIHTELLRACRLIYYEARMIPILSATHHIFFNHYGPPTPDDLGGYLFHMGSQQIKNLYHLHVIMTFMEEYRLDRFLKDNKFMWKRITWTMRTSFWSRCFRRRIAKENGFKALLPSYPLPASCTEVTIEVEFLLEGDHESEASNAEEDEPKATLAIRVAAALRGEKLIRTDGVELQLDDKAYLAYTWQGKPLSVISSEITMRRFFDPYMPVTYHVIRLCWMAVDGENKRENSRYDHVQCLNSTAMDLVERKSS
jgi:hypothetical protein